MDLAENAAPASDTLAGAGTGTGCDRVAVAVAVDPAPSALDLALDGATNCLGALAELANRQYACGGKLSARESDWLISELAAAWASVGNALSLVETLLGEDAADAALERMLGLLMQVHGMVLRLHDPAALGETQRLPALLERVRSLFALRYPDHDVLALCLESVNSALFGAPRPPVASPALLFERAAAQVDAWMQWASFYGDEAAPVLSIDVAEQASGCLQAVLANPRECYQSPYYKGPSASISVNQKQALLELESNLESSVKAVVVGYKRGVIRMLGAANANVEMHGNLDLHDAYGDEGVPMNMVPDVDGYRAPAVDRLAVAKAWRKKRPKLSDALAKLKPAAGDQ
jgi:hypothetical protein